MLVRKLLPWWWWIVSLWWERNEVWVIEDAYWWWHQEEKLCTSKISSLVEKLCLTVMLVRKTAVLMMMNSLVMVREKWSLGNWRRLLMMTSRRETLHFEDLYLSRQTLSDCHVSQKTAVLMMMNSFVMMREKWSLGNWRRLLMMTSRRETLHFEDL